MPHETSLRRTVFAERLLRSWPGRAHRLEGGLVATEVHLVGIAIVSRIWRARRDRLAALAFGESR